MMTFEDLIRLLSQQFQGGQIPTVPRNRRDGLAPWPYRTPSAPMVGGWQTGPTLNSEGRPVERPTRTPADKRPTNPPTGGGWLDENRHHRMERP